jgi:serine protease AprX
VAVALVKALGLDAAAQAKAGSDVTANYNGQAVVVSDESGIPANLRGYVQIALDKGILNAYFSFQQGPNDFQPKLVAVVNPNDGVTRSFLAFALDHYRQSFSAGN